MSLEFKANLGKHSRFGSILDYIETLSQNKKNNSYEKKKIKPKTQNSNQTNQKTLITKTKRQLKKKSFSVLRMLQITVSLQEDSSK